MKKALKQTKLYHTLRKSRLGQEAVHLRSLLSDSAYRDLARTTKADFTRFCSDFGGAGLRADVATRTMPRKKALVLSQYYLPFAKIEAVVIKALQMAGFETVVLGNRRHEFLRYGWLAGNTEVLEFTDVPTRSAKQWVDERMRGLSTLKEWLDLTFEGVHVGRFVVASTLRALRVGRLEFADAAVRTRLRALLEQSVQYALAAAEVLDEVSPDLVLIMDRGYAGYGEMFDTAINRGIDTTTWGLGYKSNRLVFKRYNTGNEREHPLSLATETWDRLRALPWTPDDSRRLRQELFDAYATQDWFSVVGTQFGKEMLSKAATRLKLGLADDKKVAVIFSHILWDGSFFYGEDLFQDYTEWFVETVRAAIANPRLHWLVKVHPAHVTKAKQQGDRGRPVELDVLEREFGSLPPHLSIVYPETDISTYSLFEIADYTVTVRGTVGIESALFGIPVITAGTGRYDRRGFTVDSTTREEYLAKLAGLEALPRLSAEQVTLAERYAYGVFFWRPLQLSSIGLEYERDGKSTPRVTVHSRSREDWLGAPDMRRLAEWLADGEAEDMRPSTV
jgi:hypothetical protein